MQQKTNWQTKKLEEICILERPYKAPEGSVPYIEIGDIDINTKKIIIKEKRSIKGSKTAPSGSVIVSRVRPTRGAIALLENDLTVSSAFTILKPKNFLKPSFLFFYLAYSNAFFDYLGEKQQGLLYPSIKEEDILNYKIHYPESFSEQERIIKFLEKVFEKTAKVKKNVEKNLQNSRDLFESYLENIFLNKDWKREKLGDLLDLLTDYHANGSYKILKQNVKLENNKGYAWMVRSTDFENNFKNEMRFIDEKSYNFLKKSKVYGGEIIISKIGNAGKVYLMPKIDRPCSLAMNLFLLRVKKDISSEYLYYFLNSQNGKQQISSRLNGTATKTITKDNVRSISVIFPKLIEQERIVKKLDKLSGQTKKLEEIYKQKLVDLEELKKSILAEAFSGRL